MGSGKSPNTSHELLFFCKSTLTSRVIMVDGTTGNGFHCMFKERKHLMRPLAKFYHVSDSVASQCIEKKLRQ